MSFTYLCRKYYWKYVLNKMIQTAPINPTHTAHHNPRMLLYTSIPLDIILLYMSSKHLLLCVDALGMGNIIVILLSQQSHVILQRESSIKLNKTHIEDICHEKYK